MRSPIPAFLVLSAFFSSSASAFIVAGANGGAGSGNNTTAAQLNLAVANPFPYFSNVVREGAGSGIYLGFSPGDRTLYVLSSRHFDAGTAEPITIEGVNYPLVSNQFIADSDLRVLAYQRGDLQVPNLPAVPLASTGPTLNLEIVIIGNGVQRMEGASSEASTSDATSLGAETGYDWDMSSTRVTRWGLNNVDYLLGSPGNGLVNSLNVENYFSWVWSADFDEPGPGEWLTSNEAMASANDSGGGAFWYMGGEWVLGGMTTAVDWTSNGQTASLFTRGSSGLYRGTFFTNVASYEAEIAAMTGVLIPEPSSLGLMLLGVSLLAARRRRSVRL